MRKNNRIAGVFGDLEGWKSAETVLQKALEVGYEVHVLFTASSCDAYINRRLLVDERIVVNHLKSGDFRHLRGDAITPFVRQNFDAVIIGASQSGEGAIAAYYAIEQSRSPCLAIQDCYGSFSKTAELLNSKNSTGKLRYLCVTDELAQSLITQSYPTLTDQIRVTGGPQFDKAPEARKLWDHNRRKLRLTLGVAHDEPVFVVAGGINGTVEMLDLLEEAIARVPFQNAKIVLETHPRQSDEDKELLADYKRRRAWLNERIVNAGEFVPSCEDILPAADFVLSGYSTTNHFGILYEIPGVIYVGTPTFQRDLMEEKGLEIPVEVKLGAAWYAKEPKELAGIIRQVRLMESDPDPRLDKIRDNQGVLANYYLNGSATERVWEHVHQLVS